MSYLRYLCLHILVSNTYCVVHVCFSCLRHVPNAPMLPDSLDLSAPSIFSNVYSHGRLIFCQQCNPTETMQTTIYLGYLYLFLYPETALRYTSTDSAIRSFIGMFINEARQETSIR